MAFQFGAVGEDLSPTGLMALRLSSDGNSVSASGEYNCQGNLSTKLSYIVVAVEPLALNNGERIIDFSF